MKHITFHLLSLGSLSFLVWLACQEAHSTPPNAVVPVTDTIAKIIVAPDKDTLDSILNLDYVMGRFDPATRSDFTIIDSPYADKAGMYMRKDAYQAFLAMYRHALKDGVQLQIKSATRNFYAQKTIWEAKWTGERLLEGGENLAETTPDPKERAIKILRYSSMPGSSRHHWGTDVDFNNLENHWWVEGRGLDIYKWLQHNASVYGFCQPYTEGRPYGYFEERWHWSYMPVSTKLTKYAKEHMKNEMIDGFLGSETAPMIDIVNRYVLGINEDCTK
jgi:zinc D-Ala-D-Ala carboxypeptidase